MGDLPLPDLPTFRRILLQLSKSHSLTSFPPGVVEGLEPNPASMTDPGASRPLQIAATFPCLQNPIQISGQIKHARGIGLGVLRSTPNRTLDLRSLSARRRATSILSCSMIGDLLLQEVGILGL